MNKHYDVEYEVIGTFTDQIYDVDNEEEAIDKATDNLRYDPIIIKDSDINILGVYEVDYNSGKRITPLIDIYEDVMSPKKESINGQSS